MTLDEAIAELRRRNEQVPIPMRLPEAREIAEIEAALGVRFHPDYVRLLLQASDVIAGPLEPATITRPSSHTYLPKVIARARSCGVPQELFPFCEDNADFYCLNKEGRIVFWSHNGWNSSTWPNLADWIAEIWLADLG
jgi:hypothetical protein